ncbi:DNA polymerase-3 subunit alpha (Gram-positive type) [Natranaerovirga pectinivora]|uniref:DNA polymerase III PolC-type n=1 Tax=Natranaerovirga pectinivora TaxID=682400 RepID=A0A4V2V0B5_9FIRM|nr:PolC-type DNA polymerase III [Natranaerovirga pectinivora]TCT15061.1 DNA polymerase-3 subunit alpha (Gram-positive type) [Natranaerovirga pectinivora]
MNRTFNAVFSNIRLNENMDFYFGDTVVEKVALNKDKNVLRVYVLSQRLIHRNFIVEMEGILSNHLDNTNDIDFKISERYELSDQYTPNKIISLYTDSLLCELKEMSPVCYGILRKAKWQLKNNSIVIEVKNNPIVRLKEKELISFVENVYNERFGLGLNVLFVYDSVTEEEKSSYDQVKKNIELEYVQKVMAESSVREETVELVTPKEETKQSPKQKNADPDLIYGKAFEGDTIKIKEIEQEMGEVIIRGSIISFEARAIKNDKYIVAIDITDYEDSITVKVFVTTEQFEASFKDEVKVGATIKVKGIAQYDTFSKEIVVMARNMRKIPSFKVNRVDGRDLKRVELHAHTMMSDMDAVVSGKDLIKRAISWGHEAIAITDHGVVQAFPEVYKAAGDDIKVIYGVEAYIVDDLKDIVKNSKNQSLDDTYVVFDIETTGFLPGKDKVTEIGAVKINNGMIVDYYSSFVNPEQPIPPEIEKLTGISDFMVQDAPKIEEVLPGFIDFIGDSVVVAHNADFDMSFINYFASELNYNLDVTVLDTVMMARMLLPKLNRYKLNTIAKELNIKLDNHHRAVDDAKATAEIFLNFLVRLKEREIFTLDKLNEELTMTPEDIKKLPTYHGIILTQNRTGLKNLYKLISLSHIDYFKRRPRIPKSVFMENREGLLIGSACEAGELYQAILRQSPREEIISIVKFYDYLEIQPIGNNAFMVKSEKININSYDELKDIAKEIVSLGEEFNKPVVATCDVHFLDPEDEVYRRIVMAAKGFSDADDQAPLYFRTTEEMLEEFSFLGKEKAEEVVIHNTKKVAGMIEKIAPVLPDKYPPVIEGSDEELRKICYEKARSLYGEELPEPVVSRLERELNSIISNGFAVMYIISQKLVWKSLEDGYLVGSRGSVGSSFAATMAGITEVNPLAAHYICPECKFSDFDSEEVKQHSGNSGCDLPDKDCPKCGTLLVKEGHDIPFETFLGFKGNKEPDIDLNFSGEYQSKAHQYTEVLFGEGHVFRAGTIGTLAEKTAYGFVKKYYDERELQVKNAEINRLVSRCTGIRRTTGQHPGGIIVVPRDQEIYSFTPVQRPANDMETKIITTHFDYHSIDHNLLKLDILGHDDPTMIRMLEDITGLDATTIKLDNKEVMSLFESTKVLKIKPEDIGGCTLGSLGIPEFGTEFVIQMLLDTKPQSFSDLVRISGLSHGTDVWLNNAQTLIKEGKADISKVISTRDDIMTYLINQGMDKELSFTIMESVRKGKGLKPEWEEAMLEAHVPDWYIWSCKQIKYMFPKAHAVAYVMMAFRIAYFKVFYPEAYYTAFFSIRASDFDYELMCNGKDRLDSHIEDYKRRSNDLSKKEKDTLKDMKVVQEMYARGIKFVPIDLYKVKSKHFQIFDEGIMPSLSAIQGLGEKAAENIVKAREDGIFLSIDDFRQRTKVSKTVIEIMKDNNILSDLPESNQLSLFG